MANGSVLIVKAGIGGPSAAIADLAARDEHVEVQFSDGTRHDADIVAGRTGFRVDRAGSCLPVL